MDNKSVKRLKQMHGSGNGANPGKLYFAFWGAFALLYIVGIALPLGVTPHYYNRMSRPDRSFDFLSGCLLYY